MSTELWKPSAAQIEQANLTRFTRFVQARHGLSLVDYRALHRWSIDEREQFWDALWDFCQVVASHKGARILIDGERMPGAKWFPDARLNFAENLLSGAARAHVDDQVIIFHGEDKVQRSLGYAELHEQVSVLAQAMRDQGVVAGDRVAAYLPNMPETIVAMLAATSIGAIWSSCSPDFGARGVLDRFGQIEPKILLCTDGYYYGGKTHDITAKVREIVQAMDCLLRVIVVPYVDAQSIEHTARGLSPKAISLEAFVAPYQDKEIQFEQLPFDHPLYILYSSGTTGVPKCIVHGAGGTLLQHLKEHQLHTDIRSRDKLFYFTTTGWMMWNWLVSGLGSGATLVLYDGSPFYPDASVLFDLCDRVGIDVFGTSAKYIDAVKKSGLIPARSHRLGSLRTILSTGSPLVAESFDFVYRSIKRDVCLSSVAGGTDIVSCFVLGNPTLPVYRGEIQCAGLGMAAAAYNNAGQAVVAEQGELVCTRAFPAMPVGFWNDDDGSRYKKAYFETFDNVWHHGDFIEQTETGGFVIYGRSDATLNPGGVRIGTAEIYRQVEQVDEVIESLVIGQNWQDDVRVILFVVLRDDVVLDEALIGRIKRQIRQNCTPRHVPAKIIQVADIPRTRSGKITELAVRDIVHGREVKNQEALANPQALALYSDIEELARD